MKKGIVAIALLAICLNLVCPAFAAEGDFVPSISYKDGPVVNDAEMNEEKTDGCIVITSLKGAEEKTTDISQEKRDLLLNVYGKMVAGEMSIPTPGDYIVRELVDISWEQLDCIELNHTHEDELKQDGVVAKISFNLGVKVEDELLVFAFHNGQWDPVEVLEVDANGNATCLFEHFCPVAFCVKNEKDIDPTGDISVDGLVLWGLLLAVSCAAVVVMSVKRRAFLR
jgi:hypothetical protein